MKPTTQVNITGTVTRLSVETEGENGGAVAVAYIEEDVNGAPLPPQQWGRAWLRLPPRAVEHLAARYATFASTDALYRTANQVADWLDEHNGADNQEIATRIMKVGEEFGEAIAAWIGSTGQNPRKGATHTSGDVAAELADVVLAALVAINSLGHDAEAEIAARVARVTARLRTTPARACAYPGDQEHDHETCVDANQEWALAAEGREL